MLLIEIWNVGVLPIRIVKSNVSSVGPLPERNQRESPFSLAFSLVSLWFLSGFSLVSFSLVSLWFLSLWFLSDFSLVSFSLVSFSLVSFSLVSFSLVSFSLVSFPLVSFSLVSLWRRVRLYYPYWQYTNLFIFRFVSLLWLRSTLRLFNLLLLDPFIDWSDYWSSEIVFKKITHFCSRDVIVEKLTWVQRIIRIYENRCNQSKDIGWSCKKQCVLPYCMWSRNHTASGLTL